MTSVQDIRGWLEEGKKKGATHMIVVCDTFSHEDCPVFVMPGIDVTTKYAEISKESMQRVMEVYALHIPWDAQLNERRAFHFDPPGMPYRQTPSRTLERQSETVLRALRYINTTVGTSDITNEQALELYGAACIVALQKLMGIEETQDDARRGWRAMTDEEKQRTLDAAAVCGELP